MADQDLKHGGLNRQKYVIHKTCTDCGGSGRIKCDCGCGLDLVDCSLCGTTGSLPVASKAVYFPLRIDGDFDQHARKALAYYASHLRADNPKFADDIEQWLMETALQDKHCADPSARDSHDCTFLRCRRS